MRSTILGLVMAAMLLAAPRVARACGRGGGGYYGTIITIALVTLSVDAGFTLWDTGSALASHHPSTAYGVVETIIALPQLALGVAATRSTSSSGFNWYTLWMGLLTAHGIWTIATAPADETLPNHWSREPLSAQQQDKRPGAILSVGPTYVPLGDLAHPGVGLSGRF
jgi:hypothetical protein